MLPASAVGAAVPTVGGVRASTRIERASLMLSATVGAAVMAALIQVDPWGVARPFYFASQATLGWVGLAMAVLLVAAPATVGGRGLAASAGFAAGVGGGIVLGLPSIEGQSWTEALAVVVPYAVAVGGVIMAWNAHLGRPGPILLAMLVLASFVVLGFWFATSAGGWWVVAARAGVVANVAAYVVLLVAWFRHGPSEEGVRPGLA